MFDQVTKLLDRNFAISHILPATLFSLANYILFQACGWLERSWVTSLGKENPWLLTSGATVSIVFLALLLMLLNRSLIRFKEGYWFIQRSWSPLMRFQLRRWNRLQERIGKVDAEIKEIEKSGRSPSRDLIAKEIGLHTQAATDFPNEETWLLPTAFGNAMRAFEVYPGVIYGFESTSGWPRLLAVIPKDYQEHLGAARAQVDFWVNTWALSIIFTLICASLSLLGTPGIMTVGAMAATAVTIAWWSSRRSRLAAVEWGEFVKAAFDIYLPILTKNLKEYWKEADTEFLSRYNQAMTFRDPEALRANESWEPEAQVESDAAPSVLSGLGRLLILLGRYLQGHQGPPEPR